ncbi:MAG: hypothetical protein GDA56_01210 [Hormoscilla sp. GM7CHS1pb]|nr:hypothetical protein [Hormoscilla sp. GM7CHS1pb]
MRCTRQRITESQLLPGLTISAISEALQRRIPYPSRDAQRIARPEVRIGTAKKQRYGCATLRDRQEQNESRRSRGY